VFLVLTPLAYRKVRWLRPLAYFYACIMLLNGLGHTVATIFGRTVSTVHFRRPAPGFYSSPLLFTASIYLLFCLTRTRQKKRATDFWPWLTRWRRRRFSLSMPPKRLVFGLATRLHRLLS